MTNRRFDPPPPTAPAKGTTARLDPAAQRGADMLMRCVLDEMALDLRKAPLGAAVASVARAARHLCDSPDPDCRSVGYGLRRAISEGHPEAVAKHLGLVRPGGGGSAADAYRRHQRDGELVRLAEAIPEYRERGAFHAARELRASFAGYEARQWRRDRENGLQATDPLDPDQPSAARRHWFKFLARGMAMPGQGRLTEILKNGLSRKISSAKKPFEPN